MRIGIDCRLWNETGVGRYTRNLVYQLAKIDEKNQYTLFFLDKEFNEVDMPSKNFEKRVADIRWHTLTEQIEFSSIIDKEILDLVHFPYFSVPIFYKRPFVVTIHDLILHHFSTGVASTLPLPLYKAKLLGYKIIISKAAKKAKKIITVSESTKDEIIDHLKVDKNKIVVTYEGVDDSISVVKSQNSKLQLKTQKYFLYVGNAYPHKNLNRLLEAFKIVKLKYSDISLVLVGKEDYFYEKLKHEVKKLGLEEKVYFFGQASDKELSQLYKNALALVLPSKMEGFGLAGLEAMANECRVVCSDIPVFREIYKEAAMYFDPTNTNDISKVLISIVDNNHHDTIKTGLEIVKQFSWGKMAKETLKVYESCIGLR